jgi:hypothetical protein
MSYEFKTGTILIRESALLPSDLAFTSEPCVPGWKIITDSDVCALDREIRKTGWTSFCGAAEIGETVFGLDEQKMLRRAIERILESAKLDGFNSLKIVGVGSVDSLRFPGVRYGTVSAHPRNIQQSLLPSANDSPCSDAMKKGIAKESIRFGGKTLRAEDPIKQRMRTIEEIAK